MLDTLYLGDYTSYYLAALNGVDPSPVRAIDELKRRAPGQRTQDKPTPLLS